MKEREVVFAPEAVEDLLEIYDWIEHRSSPNTALSYVERMEAFCQRLRLGSERGHLRDDIRPGLRIIGFERRVTIAFTVRSDTVTVLRVFAAGRDWETMASP